jgi:hypothetical protein
VIAEYCPTDILTHIQILGGFLSSNLGSDDLAVQVACSKGICACIRSLENEDQARDAFKPAIEPIVNVMGSALSNGDEQVWPSYHRHLSVIMITISMIRH